MSVWVIVGAFCVLNNQKTFDCNTVLIDTFKYKTESQCKKYLPRGDRNKCVEAFIMNKQRSY